MPGVIMLEALAQTAGILTFVTAGIYPDESVTLLLRRHRQGALPPPVVPGDQLLLTATLERRIRTIWKFSTVAEVAGEEACTAEHDGDAGLSGPRSRSATGDGHGRQHPPDGAGRTRTPSSPRASRSAPTR